jgi:cytochrome c
MQVLIRSMKMFHTMPNRPALRSIAAVLSLASLGFVAAAVSGSAAALSGPVKVAAQEGAAPDSLAFYTQKVQPILRDNCYRCHGAPNHRGNLQIDTRAGLLKGGRDGAVIVPGHPEQSLLIALIRHEGPADDPMPMPPKTKLSDADIATVSAWIKAGALMPQ